MTFDTAWEHEEIARERGPMPTMIKLDFNVGDKVRIKPCDKIDARVICVYIDWRGLTYDVRYFENGDAKVARLFPDEIELMERDHEDAVGGATVERMRSGTR